GIIRCCRSSRAPSCSFACSGIHSERSMFTRIRRSAGSSVTGSGNEPSSTSVPAFSISTSAHGPWRYIAAFPWAIAVFPSPSVRLAASYLKYGSRSSILLDRLQQGPLEGHRGIGPDILADLVHLSDEVAHVDAATDDVVEQALRDRPQLWERAVDRSDPGA